MPPSQEEANQQVQPLQRICMFLLVHPILLPALMARRAVQRFGCRAGLIQYGTDVMITAPERTTGPLSAALAWEG
jgi:hypothetical protein